MGSRIYVWQASLLFFLEQRATSGERRADEGFKPVPTGGQRSGGRPASEAAELAPTGGRRSGRWAAGEEAEPAPTGGQRGQQGRRWPAPSSRSMRFLSRYV
uniref:Uncharacterized protein n=1 Tax=Oryza sativa subsp. japonica TaxID=39947 RepID=Q67WW6_ORYSJ|nr:hypothetical protein [Oryza sativa Japonica Group]